MSSESKQKEALLSLVQGDDGIEWALAREGWSADNDDGVCYWDGVECDPLTETTVEKLVLPASGLIGTIPEQLGALTTLKVISVPKNLLRGTIPKSVIELTRLVEINIAENELTGTFPTFISQPLKKLDLSKNKLTGSIPDFYGTWHVKMVEWDVSKNNLSGPLPNTLQDMSSLQILALSGNNFSGTIPRGIGEIMTLYELYLDDNSLMGPIPISLTSATANIEQLWLQNNMLSGNLAASVASMPSLKNIYIDGNKLTGTVPELICREGLNSEFFKDVPADIEKNYCEAVACAPHYISYDGFYPCKPCKNAFMNPYLGQTGRCADMDESDVLNDLYESMGGQDWINGFDWDRPDYSDHCHFKGVTCDVNDNVIGLDFHHRNLVGTIPDSIGYLQYLEVLDLSDNHLTGYVPSDLRWAPLKSLDISGNMLIGDIPPKLCQKAAINGNGEGGAFACSQIACATGYYSETGHGVLFGLGKQCEACPAGEGLYLASKTCAGPLHSKRAASGNFAGPFFITVSVLAGIACVGYAVFRVLKRRDGSMTYKLPDEGWQVT